MFWLAMISRIFLAREHGINKNVCAEGLRFFPMAHGCIRLLHLLGALDGKLCFRFMTFLVVFVKFISKQRSVIVFLCSTECSSMKTLSVD